MARAGPSPVPDFEAHARSRLRAAYRLTRALALCSASHLEPGTLADGSKFDSSRDKGRPFQFVIGVGQVIQAWDEGMQKMSVGETAKLTCTPDYGYGMRGFPPVIPPNSNLTFEVELLGVR